jgi:CubicO group peptidase (beta-lactamase class C family)
MMGKKHSSRQVLVVLLMALSLIVCHVRSEEIPPQIDELFSKWDKPDSPGGAVAVLKEGKVILKKVFGLANLEQNIAITPQTVFCIGSVSKQFTAFCVALLESRRQLSLDDDIRTHIPEMHDYGVPITIRHLILHTSGLRDHRMLIYLSGRETGELHGADEVLEKVLARQKIINFNPGDKYEYSNSNYFLLGEIVHRVSGKSLGEFARQNIFEPLGMNSTQYLDDYTRLIENRASSYYPSENDGYRNYIDTFDLVGSGGVYTTLDDLILWVRNFEKAKVGGPEVIQKVLARGKLNTDEEIDYSFGLEHGTLKGLQTIFHSGSHGGYGAMIRWFPEQEFLVICLSNFSRLDTRYISRRIADIYLKDLFREKQEIHQIISLPREQLQDKSGFYQSPTDKSVLKVSVQNDRLLCESNFSWTVEYAPINQTEFKSVKPDTPMILKFVRSDDNPPFVIQNLYEAREINTYEPVKLVSLSEEELLEYTGEFDSEEMDTTWRMIIKEGKLYVRFERAQRRAPQGFLRPIIKDEFAAWPSIFTFFRDKDGKVSGFVFGPDKKTGIEFRKRQ